jgi:hypothetical protein
MPEAAASEAVLHGLDRLLSDRPERETHDLSNVTRNLTIYRDHVIRRVREKGSPADSLERLTKLNAVISALYAVHYPIGLPPWQLLRKARECFAALASELRAAEEA